MKKIYLVSNIEAYSDECLSKNFDDMYEKLGNIIIGYNSNNKPLCYHPIL